MRIARVFPRRTAASPQDDLAFFGPPGLFPPEVDEVHISVTFSWDLDHAAWLEKEWARVAPVRVGGPATGMRGEEFTPGMYLGRGYTFTSRGCPNHCWFCGVPRREGPVRELPIREGWIVEDDNLLACSERHIQEVFWMLHQQKEQIEFAGGLEAARVTADIAFELRALKPLSVFFAYDTPDDLEPLIRAVDFCWRAGFSKLSHRIRAYVLCGYPKDTIEAAERRMRQVLELGIFPMAMLWRNDSGKTNPVWRRFQRSWNRVQLIMQN
jgi:hypothetical protein